ncbi:MAG: hypothetical protein J6Y92_10080 [Lentisphaeria bacterium]|nr:hypothetical protein [Lentisphaeria bacterium]
MKLSPRVLAFVVCAVFAASSPFPAECAEKENGEQKAAVLETAESAYWDTARYGEPGLELPRLIKEAAKRADAEYQTVGTVRVSRIDDEYSSNNLDFMFLDEYGKILRFIEEVDKIAPRLFWRRLELRVDAPSFRATPPSLKIRLTGTICVITDTPADGAAAAEKPKKEVPSAGNRDALSLLYDLSLSLHNDAIMTSFRLNEKTCDFLIQGTNAFAYRPLENNVPGWAIRRVQQRNITDSLFTFTVSLEKEENSKPREDGITPENKILTIEALNIFDPERASKTDKPAKPTDPKEEMILIGTTFVGDVSAAIILLRDPDGRIAATLKQRMADAAEKKRQAVENRDELAAVYRTLQQSPDIPKEQAEQVRQRMERYNQEIERIREQEMELTLQGSYAGKTAATIDDSGKRIVSVGDMLPNGFTLKAVTRTTATFTRNGETVELTLRGTEEKKP